MSTFDEYYRRLPPAPAAVGTEEWQRACLTDICDYVAGNAWVRSLMGGEFDVSVLMSPAKDELVLSFKRLKPEKRPRR